MKKCPPWLAMTILLPTLAVAQGGSQPMGDARAIELIHQMEAATRPSAEIVSALVADGRSVVDATALVVGVAHTSTVRVYSTLFGMCMAVDRDELAEDVGAAAVAAAGTADENVASTVSMYTPQQCDRFFLYLRKQGSPEPRGPGPDPVPPVSPST